MHAVRVMRVKVGDTVELFDGQGYQASATVTLAGRRECRCHCEAPQFVDREPTTKLELAVAIPKPEAAKEMIERLTELGVARIQPLIFERTQRPPPSSLLDKLQRVVIEACKQSGRNHLMSIATVMPFSQWITEQDNRPRGEAQNHPASYAPPLRLVAMPGGRPMQEIMPYGSVADRVANIQCIIGPEGGLTPEELAACRDGGMMPTDLGNRILRVETAACSIAARSLWD